MSMTLLTSKNNRRAAPGCDTFDSVESRISYFPYISLRNLIMNYLLKLSESITRVKISETDRATRILRRQSTNFLITFACKPHDLVNTEVCVISKLSNIWLQQSIYKIHKCIQIIKLPKVRT